MGLILVFLWSFCLLPSPLRPRPPCSICDMSRPYLRRALKVRQQPPSGKTTKMKNHCSSSLFHSSFFQTFGTCSHTLFNPTFPSRSSKQLFTSISYLPPSKTTIFSTPFNPPQTHLLQIPCFPYWKSLSCKNLKVPVVSILFTLCTSPTISLCTNRTHQHQLQKNNNLFTRFLKGESKY